MSRQAMLIDMHRCVGCGACTIACQEEWALPEGVTRCWVRPLKPGCSEAEQSYTHYVGMCHHCEQATCLTACPTGASYRDEQGRVRVDAQVCIGCGYCVAACPYGARMLRKDIGQIEKCDLCAARTDAGMQPACVDTCPAGARIFGDLDDRGCELSRAFLDRHVRRNESREVSIGPRLFYSGKREDLDRIFAAYPPDPAKTSPPIEGAIMQKLLRPGFLVLAGLAFLGQGIAFLRQLAVTREQTEDPAAPAEPRLARRPMPAVWLHWFNALIWLFQILTGFGLLSSSSYRVTPGFFNRTMLAIFGSREAMLDSHIALGLLWLAVLLAYATFGFRGYLRPFVRGLRLRREDLSWLRIMAGRILLRSERPLPPQDKYNAGQKLFGMLVCAGTLLTAISGLAMVFLPGSGWPVRWAIPVHFAAASMVVVGLIVHLYMSLFVSSERPALVSMFRGSVPESYAREHHQLWWEEIRKRRSDIPEGDERT
ncbi:MAG: cytochrome b/b6 domain-containing protein [Deltaproteobacteria bacterium]|nr:cytochrome b/b6 domain-containing protein [Deltaproteobacteria bacterium]